MAEPDVAAPRADARTREHDLARLAEAAAQFRGAWGAIPGEALAYRPNDEDYALGGLADHVAAVAAGYARLLDALAASVGAIEAPPDEPASAKMAALLRDGAPPAEREAASSREVAALDGLVAAALRQDPATWATVRDVTFGGSAEPFPTSPALVVDWVRDHARAHARQVAELLARRERDGTAAAETLTLVRRFGAAWNDHDLAAALACCTGDIVFENTFPGPDGTTALGRDAVAEAWAPIFDNPASRFDEEEAFAAADRAVVRWSYTWGDGHVRGVDVIDVRDGLVAAKRSYVKG